MQQPHFPLDPDTEERLPIGWLIPGLLLLEAIACAAVPGPRTGPDIAYHVAIALVVIAGVFAAARSTP